jgi:hypothetical protein
MAADYAALQDIGLRKLIAAARILRVIEFSKFPFSRPPLHSAPFA